MDELEQLKQRNQQLESELAEIRRHIPLVADELWRHLEPMKGYLRTLRDDENEEWYTREDRREFYGIIDENLDRLWNLINELSDNSLIARLAQRNVMTWQKNADIRKICERVVELFKGHSNKHILVLDFDPQSILAEIDHDKFAEILHEGIRKAMKYSPKGGEIRIIARTEVPTEVFPMGALLMGVKDHGKGIPKAWLETIHNNHFIFADPSPGTDRRLSWPTGYLLVKKLVEQYGGHLWFESEGEDKGATFWFRIPLKQPK